MSLQRGLRILVVVDGSVHSEAAVKMTAGITWPAGTITHVLAVVPERWLLSHLSCEAKHMLEETVEVFRQADYAAAERLAMRISDGLQTHNLTVDSDVREGRPSEVILNRAVELAADLLVIGAKGLSAPAEFQLGSTAHKLAHYAECSVLVTRSIDHPQPSRIILAADGSIEAQRAAEFLTVSGRSNALSGFTDGAVSAPVIACPPPSDAFGGVVVFSSLRMPSGIAPAVVLEPVNAALLAAKILGMVDPAVREAVVLYQRKQAGKITDDDAALNQQG